MNLQQEIENLKISNEPLQKDDKNELLQQEINKLKQNIKDLNDENVKLKNFNMYDEFWRELKDLENEIIHVKNIDEKNETKFFKKIGDFHSEINNKKETFELLYSIHTKYYKLKKWKIIAEHDLEQKKNEDTSTLKTNINELKNEILNLKSEKENITSKHKEYLKLYENDFENVIL